MSTKQEIINKIQAWVNRELVDNKLEIILEFPAMAEFDLDKILLIDIDSKTVYTGDNSRESNEYEVLVCSFEMGNRKVVNLSLAVDNAFDGAYELNDYSVMYDSDEGTQLYKRIDFSKEGYVDIETNPLEEVLNFLDFAPWVTEEIMASLYYVYTEELANDNCLSIKEVQGLLNKVVFTEPYGMNFTRVTFESGISINLNNSVVKK